MLKVYILHYDLDSHLQQNNTLAMQFCQRMRRCYQCYFMVSLYSLNTVPKQETCVV